MSADRRSVATLLAAAATLLLMIPSGASASFKKPMKITAYAPDSGDGISGSGTMASNILPFVGAAACPVRLPFGTRVALTGRARLRAQALRLPYNLVCMDRFAQSDREGIDIAIPKDFEGLSNEQRIELARVFGLMQDWPIIELMTNTLIYSESRNEE